MKILFLTIVKIASIEERGIYTDLLRKFHSVGNEIFIVSPTEREYHTPTNLKKENGTTILQVKTFNLQKTNNIEKGIGTLAIGYQFFRAIKKHFSDEKFDLILYSTPPITFTKVIHFIKKRDKAYAYLLLKDIFPQNAIDMKLLKKGSLLHRMFLKKERKLYEESDTIGCMSEANKNYLLKHYDYLKPENVEVNPNSIAPLNVKQIVESNIAIRRKYGLPVNDKIFIYGGNLGIPQGIDFLLQTIENCSLPDVYFLIVGSGREYKRIAQWFEDKNPVNAKLLESLPKGEYDLLLKVCDIGMIFLSPNFTIPNFPSRLLSYLEYSMPVLAATDKSTDIGKVIEEARCGLSVQSGDTNEMLKAIQKLIGNKDNLLIMKKNARTLLEKNYTVDVSYRLIESKVRQHV